ncbi:uncharacterized protein [Dysidea avara]|uniref:uncharacterized protein n=1 Tax=Dysidea avara TaxID=196820 RepID=UPI0033248570
MLSDLKTIILMIAVKGAKHLYSCKKLLLAVSVVVSSAVKKDPTIGEHDFSGWHQEVKKGEEKVSSYPHAELFYTACTAVLHCTHLCALKYNGSSYTGPQLP